MRARNLKPGLFKNELLGTADPLITILFEGLWCMADREGRLEDRPLRICAEVFPYRRRVTKKKVDAWLRWLHDSSLITRYVVEDLHYIQVNEFSKHQNPHRDERPSQIPVLTSVSHSADTVVSTVQAPNKHSSSTEVAGLLTPNPESFIPDSSLREQSARTLSLKVVPRGTNNLDDDAEHAAWEATIAGYPPGAQRSDLIGAERAARRLVEDGIATWVQLREGIARYAACCLATNRLVLNPVKFFTDSDRPWSQAWPIPPGKAEKRLAGNISAADEFMRRTEVSQ